MTVFFWITKSLLGRIARFVSAPEEPVPVFADLLGAGAFETKGCISVTPSLALT